jgi:hypothetical protein
MGVLLPGVGIGTATADPLNPDEKGLDQFVERETFRIPLPKVVIQDIG